MRNRQMYLGRLRCLDEQFAVKTNGAFVVTEANPGRRLRAAVGAIARLALKELVELIQGPRVFVPPEEHLDIVEARGRIIRGEGKHGRKQQFGIIQHIKFGADPGEQAHRLDMVAVR